MKIQAAIAILGLATALQSPAATPFLNGPRDEINLAGNDWQEAIADSLDMNKIPDGLKWVPVKLPGAHPKLKSTDNQWQYCDIPPEKYFAPDGTFLTKEKLSAWYKRTVDIPEAYLRNHTVHLTIAGASYRSAVMINGKYAGGSILATLPLDFDVTKFVKPGTNELTIGITTREGLIHPKAQVYTAPSNGVGPGIRGPIRLEFRPLLAVTDVFVKTSVKDGTIDFQTTLVNSSTLPATASLIVKVRSVRDPRQVVGEFAGKPVSVAPGAEVVTDIKDKWVTPILWSLTTPEMYSAEVVLQVGDKPVDRYQQTFGFREFTVKDRDFMLNGNRQFLLRNSSLEALKTLEEKPDEISITQKFPSVNSIRQHLGCYNSDLIYRANTQGILVVPESSYSWTHIYPHDPEKAKVWLPGVLDYYKHWARLLRNEPSVIMYSVVNETYWGRNLPEEMDVCRQIVNVMHQEDPTRLLQGDGECSWNGLLDVLNIHYPEGTAGTLRLTYPNAAITVPNDIEWLKPGKNASWNADFNWDRPLVLGEFGVSSDLQAGTAFGGDHVYDWIKWRKQVLHGTDLNGGDRHINSYFLDMWRKMINYYRHIGVAGMNPWGGDLNDLLKPMVVAPLDFHPNVPAGGVFKRKIAVFNDDRHPVHKIKYYLTVNGSLVCDKEQEFWVNPGQKWSGELTIQVPNVERPVKAEFLVRLCWRLGTTDIEVDRFTEDVSIIPSRNLVNYSKFLTVVDPENSLPTAFKDLNLAPEPLKGNLIPAGKRLLVIGTNGFKDDMQKMLDKFVEDGGVVLMLPQKGWRPYRVELPERDPQHAATQAWVRLPNHPALKNMDETQFSFWGEDNVVSYETFKKPQQGPLHVVLEAGGRFGVRWSPLLDVPVGKGTFLMTTLELTKPDAGARQLLANLIEYGCSRSPAGRVKLNILAGKNSALTETLALTGAQTAQGLGTTGPVLIDASADFNLPAVKEALDKGRTVWLHNFTPESFPKIANLMPARSKLVNVPKELISTMPITDDDLTKGLARFDFAWYIQQLYYGGPLFDGATVVAKSGDWVLDTNLFTKDVKALTEPAFLVKLNVGKGTILFDTLQWEQAMSKETDKVLRLASGLVTNLNGDFQFGKKITYQKTFVNFTKFANMAFMDNKSGDGVGGWTDQGRNDMRFFLINHSGKGNGEEDGMDVPVPKFPTDVDFNGVNYRLIDPKVNNNKSVLSFGSNEHAPKLMRETGPIPVNAKADIIWLLHAIGWSEGKLGGVVAQYTVDYQDGSKTTIPIRRNIDVGDWFNVAMFPNASIAWTGKNLVNPSVGLNTMAWKNPFPEKMIKSLSIKAGLDSSQYVLVAATCGVQNTGGDSGEGEVVADFDFSKKDNHADLFFKIPQMPAQAKDGMQFAHGTALVFDSDKAGLQDQFKKPFGIVFDLTATAKPDGYCAGLIETSAFRITLSENSLKVVVETHDFDGKPLYISSTYPVELNHRVRFEYKCDGKKGVLMRDGKIETIVDAPLPNKPAGQIRFGLAGGNNYNFNGVMHQITFKSYAEDTVPNH